MKANNRTPTRERKDLSFEEMIILLDVLDRIIKRTNSFYESQESLEQINRISPKHREQINRILRKNRDLSLDEKNTKSASIANENGLKKYEFSKISARHNIDIYTLAIICEECGINPNSIEKIDKEEIFKEEASTHVNEPDGKLEDESDNEPEVVITDIRLYSTRSAYHIMTKVEKNILRNYGGFVDYELENIAAIQGRRDDIRDLINLLGFKKFEVQANKPKRREENEKVKKRKKKKAKIQIEKERK